MQKVVTSFQFTRSLKANKINTNRIIEIVPCKTALKDRMSSLSSDLNEETVTLS